MGNILNWDGMAIDNAPLEKVSPVFQTSIPMAFIEGRMFRP